MNKIVTDAMNTRQTYQSIASSCQEQIASMEELGATSEELMSMAQNLKTPSEIHSIKYDDKLSQKSRRLYT